MQTAMNGTQRLVKPGILPYVTLSFGMSLDGKIATRTGESKYISGPEARAFVHELRNRHDGILVGINTILADHPKLTTRLVSGTGRDAHRIILDSRLRIHLDEPVLHLRSAAKTILVSRTDADPVLRTALEEAGAVVIGVADPHTSEGLREALARLKAMGIGSILVEGGSSVHFTFIANGLFDRLYATVSPVLIGGETAKSAVGGAGFASLSEAATLSFVGWTKVGPDYVIEAVPAARNE